MEAKVKPMAVPAPPSLSASLGHVFEDERLSSVGVSDFQPPQMVVEDLADGPDQDQGATVIMSVDLVVWAKDSVKLDHAHMIKDLFTQASRLCVLTASART